MTVVVGIDPGLKGYAVMLHAMSPAARVHRLSFDKAGTLDFSKLAQINDSRIIVFMEKVQGRGGWSAGSNFSLGRTFGQLEQAIQARGWPMHMVTPQTWQKRLCGGVDAKLSAKERTAVAYKRLFPHEPLPRNKVGRVDDNALDAWMIAVYGVLVAGGGVLLPWTPPPVNVAPIEARRRRAQSQS